MGALDVSRLTFALERKGKAQNSNGHLRASQSGLGYDLALALALVMAKRKPSLALSVVADGYFAL